MSLFGGLWSIATNGSYMKRGFARMFQITTNLLSHVLYTVLYAAFQLVVIFFHFYLKIID
jgi:hypothetical protein